MGTKDNLDSFAPHLDPTGLKPPTSSTKTPHPTPEANPSSWVWPQRKWFSFLMNLGCVDPVKREKLSLPNKDRNKTLSLTLLLLKGTGRVRTLQVAGKAQHQIPIAQIDCSSKGIHLGPPGPAPADVLLVLPLNSVVKVLQGNGAVLGASVCPAFKVTWRQECCCTLSREMASPRGWDNMEKTQSRSTQLHHWDQNGAHNHKDIWRYLELGMWSSPSDMNMPINSHWGLQGLGRDAAKRLGMSTASKIVQRPDLQLWNPSGHPSLGWFHSMPCCLLAQPQRGTMGWSVGRGWSAPRFPKMGITYLLR